MSEPSKGGWNWWAFMFGPLALLYRGIWLKAFGVMLLAAVVGGLVGAALGLAAAQVAYLIVGHVYTGLKYNEERYTRWCKRQIELGNIQPHRPAM